MSIRSPSSRVKKDISTKDGLIFLDARRIVLPKAAIKPILTRLHLGHAGEDKTLKLVQQLYFWHGMSNDIKTVIFNCNECQTRRPSQVTNPRTTPPPSESFGAPHLCRQMVRISLIQTIEHNFNTISIKCVGIVVQYDGLAGNHQVGWRATVPRPIQQMVQRQQHHP